MSWGKILAQVVAAPIKVVVALPDEVEKAVDEIARAFDGPPEAKPGIRKPE